MPDLLGGHRWRPPEAYASGLGGGQALVGAFDDEFADELGEGGEHVEHQAPARGGGVEGFLQRPESHAATAQVRDDRDEVLQGAGEPVERGDDEGVARPQVVERAWGYGSRASGAVPMQEV
jgi:hypothetical protein